MAPRAAVGEVTITAAMVWGVILGALGGAIAWRLRSGLIASGVVLISIYVLAIVVPDGFFWLNLSLTFGVLPLAQSALVSRALAQYLEARQQWRPLWSGTGAVAGSLVAGWLCLWSRTLDTWAPNWVAGAVSACLLVLLLMTRRSPSA